MSNQHFNYYDPEYDTANASEYDLLIMVTDTNFSLAVVQKQEDKVLLWGEGYSLNELVEPDELKGILLAKFAEVKIGVLTGQFSVVHKDLYNADKLADHAKYLDTRPGEVVIVNLLDDDNYVIFKIGADLAKTIRQHFDLRSVFFAGKAWIAAINVAKPYIQPLYVHVKGSHVQVYHATDNKLDLYNKYQFNNADELMYYIVLVANELNINLDAASVILSGDITVSDKRIQRLSDLLPKVYFNQNQVVSLPSGFMSHQILMLSGLTLCGSSEEN